MSRPPTPGTMKDILVKEGLKVKEYEGWEGRCRCCSGAHDPHARHYIRSWGDYNGVLDHITGGGLGLRTTKKYIKDIILYDPALLGKAQIVISPWGNVWLCMAGRANHAGLVGAHVRTHFVREDFSLTSAYDSRWRGASADGNAFLVGVEVIAARKMNRRQRAALIKVNAAFARNEDWTGRGTAGHGECSSARGPQDPGEDMGNIRRDTITRVKAGPSGKLSRTKEDDDMPLTRKEIDSIAKAVWSYGILSTNDDANKGKKYSASDYISTNNRNIWSLFRNLIPGKNG